MIKTIKEFFKPCFGNLLIFIILMFISWVGATAAWCFSAKDMGLPKPLFYDFLGYLGYLWIIWALLLWPIDLFSKSISMISGHKVELLGGPEWSFWVIQAVYFYSLSYVINFTWRKSLSVMLRKKTQHNECTTSA